MSDNNYNDAMPDEFHTNDQDDELVCICLGCLSPIPDHIAEKDPFLAQGMRGVHKGCGGPTIIIPASRVEGVKERRRSGHPV